MKVLDDLFHWHVVHCFIHIIRSCIFTKTQLRGPVSFMDSEYHLTIYDGKRSLVDIDFTAMYL